MNAISINRLAGLGDASGRLVPEEVEARIANDHRPPIQDDYVTFSVPAALAEASEVERKAKVPKEERRYWGDKTDFCRCLEVVINEVRGIKGRNTRPSTLGPEMLQAREQMILTTEYKTKLAKLRELQATVREGSATADRMRQEEEELAAKHAAEMERLNAKYGGSLRSVKRKRTASVMAAGGIGEKVRTAVGEDVAQVIIRADKEEAKEAGDGEGDARASCQPDGATISRTCSTSAHAHGSAAVGTTRVVSGGGRGRGAEVNRKADGWGERRERGRGGEEGEMMEYIHPCTTTGCELTAMQSEGDGRMEQLR
eukprot:766569-Hanusia_phi.AAC.4